MSGPRTRQCVKLEQEAYELGGEVYDKLEQADQHRAEITDAQYKALENESNEMEIVEEGALAAADTDDAKFCEEWRSTPEWKSHLKRVATYKAHRLTVPLPNGEAEAKAKRFRKFVVVALLVVGAGFLVWKLRRSNT